MDTEQALLAGLGGVFGDFVNSDESFNSGSCYGDV